MRLLRPKLRANFLKFPTRKSIGGHFVRTYFAHPQETSRAYRVIPLEKRKDIFIVGMLRPDDVRAQEALRFIAKRERLSLGVYIVTPSDLALVWRRYAPYRTEIEAAVKDIGEGRGRDDLLVVLDEGTQTAEDAPIIKVVASTLREAVELKASDIHIEPQRARLRIRFRVDGELEKRPLCLRL